MERSWVIPAVVAVLGIAAMYAAGLALQGGVDDRGSLATLGLVGAAGCLVALAAAIRLVATARR